MCGDAMQGGPRGPCRGNSATCWNGLILLLPLLLLWACVFEPPAPGPPGPVDEILEDARFEPEPTRRAGLIPADVFWLVEGDRVFVTWKDYLVEMREAGEEPRQCRLCLVDELEPAEGEEPPVHVWNFRCFGTHGNVGMTMSGRPITKVVEQTLPIFDHFDDRRTIDYRAGCRNLHGADPPAFTPTRDARFLLEASTRLGSRATETTGDPTAAAPLTVFHVQDRRILEPRPLSPWFGARQWKYTVSGADDLWDENFSDRLRIREIRILKSTTAGFEPMSFTSIAIENGPRCYATGGIVDLGQCRLSPDAARGTPVDATPAYLASLKQLRTTWTVTFPKPEVLQNDEQLMIEFALEAK